MNRLLSYRNIRSLYRRASLSYAPFQASFLVILGLAVFIGIFWLVNEYQTYQESIANIRRSYRELYQARVREELDNVLNFIEHRRSLSDQRIENELREKVQSAYTIASHVYRMYREEKSIPELRTMVAEILRPIRWNNGLGYYFAGRLTDGIIDLFADDPFLEGQRLERIRDISGKSVAPELKKILAEKGAGVYRYRFIRNNFSNKSFPTILFVKAFEPFDWYIGAVVSNEAMEHLLQEDILSTTRDMRFDKDGCIICFRFDGTIISHPEKRFIGRSITDLVGLDDSRYGERMLAMGLQASREGYVQYTGRKIYSGPDGQRLSFVRAYPAWNWILAADMSMDAMHKAIEKETRTYLSISLNNVLIFIGLFATAVFLLLGVAYYHSIKIRHGISLFTDFFRKAADNQVKIKDSRLAFVEFEELARLANTMVDDRIQKERILRRDELRLDTLLQLGMMEDYTIADKYDFVLYRIALITGSTCGYIALVDDSQTHITLSSLVIVGSGKLGLDPEDSTEKRIVSNGDIPGRCITEQRERILNRNDTAHLYPSFPYRCRIRNRLDVPIINDGRVVLVAGVCNSSKDYDKTDVRQITMLLEGLWLHILKICSEKEMARLEQQVIAISEKERSKIGRDLHDDLGSHLSGVELLSKALQQKLEKEAPGRAEQLATIRRLIREAIEKTRRFSRGLYPVHLIEYGLESAIDELLVELEQLYPVQCALAFDNRVEHLDRNQVPHVYYIIREALFNAARHGRPEMIQILVHREGRYLTVSIIDDGQGVNESNLRKGMGLHTMRYRAKAIGAILDVQPCPTQGTIVTLRGEVFP